MNVVRTLGGTVSARNPPQGGAVVTISLPLSAIALDAEPEDTEQYQGVTEHEHP